VTNDDDAIKTLELKYIFPKIRKEVYFKTCVINDYRIDIVNLILRLPDINTRHIICYDIFLANFEYDNFKSNTFSVINQSIIVI